MTVRQYSSRAGQLALASAITSSATSATLTSVAGLPASVPYTLILDAGATTEEIITVNAISGTSLTDITRAEDGTIAQDHAAGAVVLHGVTARDLQESRDHEALTGAVHGVAGSVVGTTDTQTLTNKTISGGSNTLSGIAQSSVTGLVSGLATLAAADTTEAAARAAADTSEATTRAAADTALANAITALGVAHVQGGPYSDTVSATTSSTGVIGLTFFDGSAPDIVLFTIAGSPNDMIVRRKASSSTSITFEMNRAGGGSFTVRSFYWAAIWLV